MIRRKSSSPLDEQKRELAARELHLQQERERLEKLIEDSPTRVEEERARRRQELIERAASGGSRLETPSSLRANDFREACGPRNRPRLKVEQKAQRLRFFALFVLLLVLLFLLLSKLRHPL